MIRTEYTRSELKILWHLKRNHGVVEAKSGRTKDAIIARIAETLDMRRGTISYCLRELEKKCLLIRTFSKGGGAKAGSFDFIIRVELIDPQMYLPPLPAPLPLATVINHENNDLYERTAIEEASNEAVMLALVTENEKLRFQINKLQEVVATLAKENEELKKQHAPRRRDEHLNQRIQDALPPEVWDQLHHKGRR